MLCLGQQPKRKRVEAPLLQSKRFLSDACFAFLFLRYSKRMLLAGVYTSSELFMLSDTSQDFEDTWHYVDRSIGRVLKMGKAGNDVLSFIKGLAEGPPPGSSKTTRV